MAIGHESRPPFMARKHMGDAGLPDAATRHLLIMITGAANAENDIHATGFRHVTDLRPDGLELIRLSRN